MLMALTAPAHGSSRPERDVEVLPPEGKLASTVAALAAPRRLIPIVLVCIPLVVAQQRYSYGPHAAAVGIAMCVTFVLAAPFLWRWLEPTRHRRWNALARLLGYGLSGVLLVGLVGVALPTVLGLRGTFLTGREALSVAVAMFWVGGWGLGRDIDFEVDLLRARARARELEREAERVSLLALRSHLDPHFLFNTLNAIAEWCREDGETAERALLELSAMLRTMMSGVRVGAWPLRRELELVDALISLHRIRDPEALVINRVVDESLGDRRVPPLLLLPLVENAVKHGPASGHRGTVELRVERVGTGTSITVQNPGPFVGRRPGGEGVAMVDRRLALAYGDEARLGLEQVSVDGSPHTRARVLLSADVPRTET